VGNHEVIEKQLCIEICWSWKSFSSYKKKSADINAVKMMVMMMMMMITMMMIVIF
jgi:hypothetical protein